MSTNLQNKKLIFNLLTVDLLQNLCHRQNDKWSIGTYHFDPQIELKTDLKWINKSSYLI